MFDNTVSVLELSSVNCDLDWSIDGVISNSNVFVDTVITYISGFIMRRLINNEKCTFCYTYLKESKNRVTCPLIDTKQLGGLIYPITDIVWIVTFANRKVKLYFFFRQPIYNFFICQITVWSKQMLYKWGTLLIILHF